MTNRESAADTFNHCECGARLRATGRESKKYTGLCRKCWMKKLGMSRRRGLKLKKTLNSSTTNTTVKEF